jgi:magnesium transporter
LNFIGFYDKIHTSITPRIATLIDHNSEIDVSKTMAEVDELIDLYQADSSGVQPFDIKEVLLQLRDHEEDLYLNTLKKIPSELLADVIAEMPPHLQEEASERLGIKKLAKIASEMDTDDAADFLKNIGEKNISRAENILNKINPEDQETIRKLISYEDDLAGAYMQTELFSTKEDEIVGESISRLRLMKRNNEIQGISQVFILKDSGEFICSIGPEELVLLNPLDSFKSSLEQGDIKKNEIAADHFENIKTVVEKVSDYNLPVIPVIDEKGILLGRITSDDIYDLIENRATEEIFGKAGLNAEVEQADNIGQAARQRALWLGVNLLTAIAASVVVAMFDSTLQTYVSLTILMPIVASMGGNAGTQSLTVTVRQLSIGEIELEDAIDTIKKEVSLALINGLFFAIVIGTIAFFWFKIPALGVVIAISTIINILIAGFSGAVIPYLLDRLKIDPAIASTVLLTTITDIIGFLSFLGLAKLMM